MSIKTVYLCIFPILLFFVQQAALIKRVGETNYEQILTPFSALVSTLSLLV